MVRETHPTFDTNEIDREEIKRKITKFMKKQTRQFNPSTGRHESANASVRLFIFPMLCADGIIRIWVLPYIFNDDCSDSSKKCN